MANKAKIAWDHNGSFFGQEGRKGAADHSVYVQGTDMDGIVLDYMKADVEGLRPDHQQARLRAIFNGLHKLVVDGKTIPLQPNADGTTKFPRIVNLDTAETLTDYLLTQIVKNDPTLVALMPDTFSKFVDEDEDGEEVDEDFPTS